MKKICFIVLIVCVVFSLGFSEVKGPYADKVYVNTRMKEEIGLKDTAEGLTDVFLYGVSGPTLYGMPQEDLDKLEIYSVPSGSWSININNYPGVAPYQVEKDGKTLFNPFAIEEVRFAMNFLIDRKYIVDEILGGAGFPMFTMATTGQPGTTKYNKIAEDFGFTDEGDEQKAIKDITAAMEAAAALPENQGRLVKGADFWEFDGEPVTIGFLIRVDDPNGRLREGNYISDQIEKAGIKVDRLIWDRAKASATTYRSNPADYEWNLYTEGWGAGSTRKYWENVVAQMYAPWYGYMPGGATAENWNTVNEELDKYTQDAFYGRFLTIDEYWEDALEGLRLGLKDALRIYVCAQTDFYTANKARFEQRFAYGLGDGVNDWMFITGKTPDGILNVTQFSAQGALFMSAWDPIGNDGFSDTYSTKISKALIDGGMSESPVSGELEEVRAHYYDVETKVERVGDELVGQIQVPADAVKYDPVANEWASVGEGVTAYSKTSYSFTFTQWHDGTPMTLLDLIYNEGFRAEWSSQDGDNDKEYESAYASLIAEGIDIIKGFVFDFENETITTYFDYNFPPSVAKVAGTGCPSFTVSAAGGVVCGDAWTIIESIAEMIINGSESGTQYSISADDDNEIDILVPSHVADILAKLKELKAAGHIPAYLKGLMSAEEADTAYANAITFIEEMGHAYIGNGPFILTAYDPQTNFLEMTANRNWAWSADYWMNRLEVPRIVINDFKVPTLVPRGKDIEVQVDLSKVVYPSVTPEIADEGTVEVFLGNLEGISGQITNAGEFKLMIPGSMTKDLDKGTYEITVKAELAGAIPVEKSKSIILW
ncbi:MAG TPA: ABC transporter substrate-binding protein [Thermotogota bacterium]|nr:ABC transporter substrate-binding protein [Thermotogota bacterium]